MDKSVFNYILKRLQTHLLTCFHQYLIFSKHSVEQFCRNMHMFCIILVRLLRRG